MRKNMRPHSFSSGVCFFIVFVSFISMTGSEINSNFVCLSGEKPLEVVRDKILADSVVIKNGRTLNGEVLAEKVNPPEKSTSGSESKPKTSEPVEGAASSQFAPSVVEQIKRAKALLKKGVDTLDSESLQKAREQFIGLLAKEKQVSLYLLYYVALCDYRLANSFLIAGETDKVTPYLKEGRGYLEKAMEMDPEFGELDALYSFLLGFEIAIDYEKAMTLGVQIYQYSSQAQEKSPENPRVHLMKGISDFFTPEQYGGGTDAAISSLGKSIALFEKENIQDPVKPSWGKDEAYTFLGMAYVRKGETEKARDAFRRALEINPDFGLAVEELRKIEK